MSKAKVIAKLVEAGHEDLAAELLAEGSSELATAGALKLLGESDKLIEFLVGDLKKNMERAHKQSMNLKRVGSHNITALQFMETEMPKWLTQVRKRLDTIDKQVKDVVKEGE